MASLLSEIDVIGNLHKTFFLAIKKVNNLLKMGSFFIRWPLEKITNNGQLGCVTTCG